MRYRILDYIRGINLINMVIYHSIWDLVYIFDINWTWYKSEGAYIWQQSICWIFILLSGFCWDIGKHKLKRGLIVFGAGIIVTVSTMLFMSENQIIFGILTLLGSCTLLLIPLEKILKKISAIMGFFGCMLLFLGLKQINEGYIGMGQAVFCYMPKELYQGYLRTYIGFKDSDFYSTDYFSLFPWLFLFMAGYFLYQVVYKKGLLKQLQVKKDTLVEYIGKHSLIIYLLHQPAIYLVLTIYFEMVR
ncbi:MAG: DUF1624 domain-containing protein [Cellulosilyticum sp.]|nr:DUF1624 domain-containing protein [Cellulosilyticum sp.]